MKDPIKSVLFLYSMGVLVCQRASSLLYTTLS